MSILIWSIVSVVVVGLISFVGVLGLLIRQKLLHRLLLFLVALSAGSLLGGAFFHLLPESLSQGELPLTVFVYLIFGFSVFFVLERILRWHHCHNSDCETHKHLGWLNLFGDGIHNLIDGMIIFAAFMVGPQLGVPITLSIILHEIPQELGDFGVLIYAGFTRFKALSYNFISALVSLVGVVLAYWLNSHNIDIKNFLLPFAAGGFIYIAASDLIPELHKEEKTFNSISAFLVFIMALVLMFKLTD